MLQLIEYQESANSLSLVFEGSEETQVFKTSDWYSLRRLLQALAKNALPPIFIEDGQTVREVLEELLRVNIDLHIYEVKNIIEKDEEEVWYETNRVLL